jgi:hypothetical protein
MCGEISWPAERHHHFVIFLVAGAVNAQTLATITSCCAELAMVKAQTLIPSLMLESFSMKCRFAECRPLADSIK